MEKLAKVTGFSSGNKQLNILHTKSELEKKKKTYNSVNLNILPDKGARIKKQIDELENLLLTLSLEPDINKRDNVKTGSLEDVHCDSKTENVSSLENKENSVLSNSGCTEKQSSKSECTKKHSSKSKECKNDDLPFCKAVSEPNKFLSFGDLTPNKSTKVVHDYAINSPSFQGWREHTEIKKTLLTKAKPLIEDSVSKASLQKHFTTKISIETSEDCVKKIHHSLVTYPDDTKESSEPETLKTTLMVHQRRGLAWLMWREQQDPSGGILADDMGLGKTLSMISLILKQKERKDYYSFKRDANECRGTLVICLASIIHQWDEEIRKHTELDALKVLVYHGPKRSRDLKQMMSYDIVLTTYNIILSEKKAMDNSQSESPLFKLKWERIVLDEAHTIKNHVSQTAQAVFCLSSFRKWAITGTPIHNVFKDIYSLVKFLQFSPFDDLKKFKGLTNDTLESSKKRRNLLIKSIVLRRTKEQVDEWGKPLIEMKNKSLSLHFIDLSSEERQIYDKLSEKVKRTFDQFIEKTHKLRSNGSLLVLLLRLQQCCSHPCLLGKESEADHDSSDVADILSSLTINDSTDSSSVDSGLDLTFSELSTDKLSDQATKSSKISALFSELLKVSEESDNRNKSVIVSQWVSMLDVVAYHLKQNNIGYHTISGSTKVEDRQKFAEDFNFNDNGVKVMLLSLKAGGVGLNLIGANHLFLLDLHWNPALEMQACDRIHRVGQKKDVVIHKFICKRTIEEKINELQNSKRTIASSALHGTKQDTKGLTIEDFKMLFRAVN